MPLDMKAEALVADEEKLPEDGSARVGWAYTVADDVRRTEARFDAWADHYDDDVTTHYGWRGPAEIMKVTEKYIAPEASILDAGSGTGLVGQVLAANGYRNITGNDISHCMLDIAAEKNVYRNLHKANLLEPLVEPDEHYDAVLSVGTSGYITGESLAEFVRVTKPGGYIMYTTSDRRYAEGGFDDVTDGLVAGGVLQTVEKTAEFAPIPRAEPEHLARVHVLKKLR